MKRELEALLFATDSPLTPARLKKIFPDEESGGFRKVIEELQAEYEESGHAFTVQDRVKLFTL